jgi:hypothetical protein
MPHPRIEPKVVAVWIKGDWHTVVDGRRNSIWGGGQNRRDFYRVDTGVPPAIPFSRNRELLHDFRWRTERELVAAAAIGDTSTRSIQMLRMQAT